MESFKVREEAGILHVRFVGDAHFQSFKDYLYHIDKINLPAQLRILHDNRESVPQIKPNKVIELAELFKKFMSKYEDVKIAYIHSDPIGVALAQLFKNYLDVKEIRVEVFSGPDAALKWLKN